MCGYNNDNMMIIKNEPIETKPVCQAANLVAFHRHLDTSEEPGAPTIGSFVATHPQPGAPSSQKTCHCRKCGRRLSNPLRVALGIGKWCAKKENRDKELSNSHEAASDYHANETASVSGL